jgi:uncharacterized membrane protein
MERYHYIISDGGDHIMGRHYYPIWPLIHLIGIASWIALFMLLICVLMSWLCRKRGHMSHRRSQCCRHQCYSQCRSHCHPTPPPHPLDALEILRQRYASGEIDDTTFQHMRERLGASFGVERPPEG